MQVAVVTLPLWGNYGGILQNYALCHVLKNIGHDPVTLRWADTKYRLVLYKQPFVYAKRILQGKEVLYERRLAREYPLVFAALHEFVRKYIPQTDFVLETPQQARDYLVGNDIQALVFGSDQIWRKNYSDTSVFNRLLPQHIFPTLYDYFGAFAETLDVRRISYAASFGVDYSEYSTDEKEIVKRLISSFDAVSVREDGALSLICDHYRWNRKPDVVLDPTLLLNRADYKLLTDKANTVRPEGNIFAYILDENADTQRHLADVAHTLTGKIYTCVMHWKDGRIPLAQRIMPSVEQWLRNFADADMVLTDSFHAVVFSIIFNKRFVVLGNAMRGNSRFTSLLDRLGLSERLCPEWSKVPYCMRMPIDWNDVNERLQKERAQSMQFLINSLT